MLRWIACMLRELTLVGCSNLDIIDMMYHMCNHMYLTPTSVFTCNVGYIIVI
jgi:hypothetical protein